MRSLIAGALALVAAGLAVGLLHHGTDPAGGLRIAFVSGNALDEIDLAGGRRHTLRTGVRSEGFTPLPDGSRVVAAAARLVHVDGSGRFLADLGPGALPAVSPDGRQLALSVLSATGRGAQVWVVDVEGAGRRQLTSGAYDILPEWSPDGTTLLFTRFATPLGFEPQNTRSWLVTVPAIGGAPRRLTTSGYDGGGVYSPDGRSIAFGSARDKAAKLCGEDECRWQSELYVMAADGSGAHRVTGDFLGDASPVFASNTTIVYSRAPATKYDSELYRIDVDGSCRRRLTHDALDDVRAAIIPAASSADLPCPAAQGALPPGSNFNTAASTLTPRSARAWRGLPLYWLGDTAGPFVLSAVGVEAIHPPEGPPAKTAYVIYTCLPASGDCSRRLQLIMTPACARPTFPATGRGAITRTRGVPRVRYLDRDELLLAHTIITIYGDAPARELAERELRSFSARPRGSSTASRASPRPSTGAPLPAHP